MLTKEIQVMILVLTLLAHHVECIAFLVSLHEVESLLVIIDGLCREGKVGHLVLIEQIQH